MAQSPALTVPASQLDLPGLKPHSLDPTKGLDETTIITLAVLNNPDLKAARLRAGVAQAQILEAGLLPDPQVSGGLSQSTKFTGYNVSLGEDIQALITCGAAKAAAKAHARQVNLEILWQELQVAQKARELFIQSRADRRLRRVFIASRNMLINRHRQDEAALQRENVTAGTVAAGLNALMDANKNLRQLQLKANQTHHNLNLLLGLDPDTQLHLIGRGKNQPLSKKQFQAAIEALPHRRADLLALQAGYQSQEQLLRKAILAQFPAMSAGVEQARSAEEGVHTIGFTVNLTLPLFNRNRGQIAIQRATRDELYQTFQARLDQAVSEADQIWRATQIMARQLQNLNARLPELKKIAVAAQQNFQEGRLDSAAFTSLKLNFLAQQTQAIRLRAKLDRAQSALQILLGLPLNSGTS